MLQAQDQTPASTLRTENLSIAYAKVALVLARAGRNMEAIDDYRPCRRSAPATGRARHVELALAHAAGGSGARGSGMALVHAGRSG